MAKAGRPTDYCEELAETICVRIAGGESLRTICKDDDMPAMSTVLLWVVDGKHSQFSEQYHIAREAAGYIHADDAMDLASKLENGLIDPQVARVMFQALTWGAERKAPKRHSQRQEIDHTSADGSMTPQVTKIEIVAPSDHGKD